MSFEIVKPGDFSFAPFKEIGENWGLLTGQSEKGFNSMTVSWGAAGILWSRPCIFVFVRPQRYTFRFTEEGDCFSLSLMPENYHKPLGVFGSKSGADTDKYALSGLTAGEYHGVHYCEEAKTVFICKKLAAGDVAPDWFVDSGIDGENYPNKDYHRMYIGEITAILEKK